MKKDNNVIRFHPHFQLNIGIIMCLILFIYVLFHVFSFLTSENITIYEVNEGSINTANKFTALAIRDEEVVPCEAEGVVNYYQHSNSRIGIKSLLYSVDTIGTTTDLIKKNDSNISSVSSADKQNIMNNISSFVNDYNGSNYAATNSFKTDLSSTLSQVYNTQAFNELSGEIDKATSSGEFKLIYGKKEGLFMMSYDGMEDLSIDNFSSDSFDINNSNKVIMTSDVRLKQDDPVGRLITSDKWYLVVPISKKYAKNLADEKYIEVKFEQDGCTTWCESSVTKKGGKHYLILKLDDSLERYADSRYLSIELLINQNNGLKIPNSSIVSKEFFAVPKAYFLEGGDSNDLGLVVKSSNNEFVSPTIYYETEDAYYIDDEFISPSASIIMPNSTETYRIDSNKASLQGVYNVNKGFAVFKQIEILYQSNDYTIIKKGTNYGVSLYDHIVLEGDKVKENQMIN